MNVIQTHSLSSGQKKSVRKLWNQEYPEKLYLSDDNAFEDYLHGLKVKHHYLLADSSAEILGWGFVFEREQNSWFALIVDSCIQGQGHGTKLLNALKEQEEGLCGWVIDHSNDLKQNGELYLSPLAFYLKNGFVVNSEIRLETEKISAVKIEWTI